MKKQKNQLKITKEENPLPDFIKNQKLHTVKEFFDELDRRLGEHYGEEYYKGLIKIK